MCTIITIIVILKPSEKRFFFGQESLLLSFHRLVTVHTHEDALWLRRADTGTGPWGPPVHIASHWEGRAGGWGEMRWGRRQSSHGVGERLHRLCNLSPTPRLACRQPHLPLSHLLASPPLFPALPNHETSSQVCTVHKSESSANCDTSTQWNSMLL